MTGEERSLPVMKEKGWKKGWGRKGETEVDILEVDNRRKVKFRRYRVSADSRQGQRCRNSIPEPRQQMIIKPPHLSSSEDRNGQKHRENRQRKHKVLKSRRKEELSSVSTLPSFYASVFFFMYLKRRECWNIFSKHNLTSSLLFSRVWEDFSRSKLK